MNALGQSLGDRVYGPELMLRACAHAARTGQRLYLYGGRNQGALVQLARNLRLRFPGLKIVGGYSPPFRPLTEEERAQVIEEINGSRADVVWVGIGVPKQEKLMAADASAPDRAGADRRRRGVRFPCGARPAGATAGCRRPGSSGHTASRASRGACGGVTAVTTRASCARSVRNSRATAGACATTRNRRA